MKVIVPLQGVVQQGAWGLFLGSVIPCALLYFLQFYFKTRHRNDHTPPPPTASNNNLPLPHLSALNRSLSPRIRGSTASAYVSGRVNSIIIDSPYYLGLNKVADNPYHRIHNPDGVIQLGLAQNTVSSFSSLVFMATNNCVCDFFQILLCCICSYVLT
jgi:aminotransferase